MRGIKADNYEEQYSLITKDRKMALCAPLTETIKGLAVQVWKDLHYSRFSKLDSDSLHTIIESTPDTIRSIMSRIDVERLLYQDMTALTNFVMSRSDRIEAGALLKACFDSALNAGKKISTVHHKALVAVATRLDDGKKKRFPSEVSRERRITKDIDKDLAQISKKESTRTMPTKVAAKPITPRSSPRRNVPVGTDSASSSAEAPISEIVSNPSQNSLVPIAAAVPNYDHLSRLNAHSFGRALYNLSVENGPIQVQFVFVNTWALYGVITACIGAAVCHKNGHMSRSGFEQFIVQHVATSFKFRLCLPYSDTYYDYTPGDGFCFYVSHLQAVDYCKSLPQHSSVYSQVSRTDKVPFSKDFMKEVEEEIAYLGNKIRDISTGRCIMPTDTGKDKKDWIAWYTDQLDAFTKMKEWLKNPRNHGKFYPSIPSPEGGGGGWGSSQFACYPFVERNKSRMAFFYRIRGDSSNRMFLRAFTPHSTNSAVEGKANFSVAELMDFGATMEHHQFFTCFDGEAHFHPVRVESSNEEQTLGNKVRSMCDGPLFELLFTIFLSADVTAVGEIEFCQTAYQALRTLNSRGLQTNTVVDVEANDLTETTSLAVSSPEPTIPTRKPLEVIDEQLQKLVQQYGKSYVLEKLSSIQESTKVD